MAADPEVIVLGDAAYGTTPEIVAKRPGWGTMAAVKAGAIRPADDVIITRPGPRLAEGLVALAVAIHPELASAFPSAVPAESPDASPTASASLLTGMATRSEALGTSLAHAGWLERASFPAGGPVRRRGSSPWSWS